MYVGLFSDGCKWPLGVNNNSRCRLQRLLCYYEFLQSAIAFLQKLEVVATTLKKLLTLHWHERIDTIQKLEGYEKSSKRQRLYPLISKLSSSSKFTVIFAGKTAWILPRKIYECQASDRSNSWRFRLLNNRNHCQVNQRIIPTQWSRHVSIAGLWHGTCWGRHWIRNAVSVLQRVLVVVCEGREAVFYRRCCPGLNVGGRHNSCCPTSLLWPCKPMANPFTHSNLCDRLLWLTCYAKRLYGIAGVFGQRGSIHQIRQTWSSRPNSRCGR